MASKQITNGIDAPSENWHKVPNVIWEHVTDMTGAEFKVVMYIIRHTWGFHQFDKHKRITLDEFQHGRKHKDGSRIDKGCGLQRGSIIDALQRAVEHGFISVDIDDSDKARVQKSYMLNIIRGTKNAPPQSENRTPEMSENRTPNIERKVKETVDKEKLLSPTPATSAGMGGCVGSDDDRQGTDDMMAEQPSVADASAKKIAPKKIASNVERPANPMYDAIADVLGAHGGQNGLYAALLSGRAKRKGWAEYNLPEFADAPITPDELRAWAAEYRRDNPALDVVKAPGKLASALMEYRRKRKPSGDGATDTAPDYLPRPEWLGYSRRDWAVQYVREAMALGASIDAIAAEYNSTPDVVQALLD